MRLCSGLAITLRRYRDSKRRPRLLPVPLRDETDLPNNAGSVEGAAVASVAYQGAQQIGNVMGLPES